MLMRALTKPRTTEYSHSHLLASHKKSLLRSSPASRPINPSVETTKGVKCLRCSRQDCRCFLFFSRSCEARTLWGSQDRYDLASVSVTGTSIMTSVPRAQKPRMRRSPRSSSLERDKRWTGGLGSLALVSSAVRLEWIIGSTRTAEGASALDAMWHSSSLISLCHKITRPPTLHSRAWRWLWSQCSRQGSGCWFAP
jgi:hypothetical protein